MGNNPADSIRLDLRVQEAESGETISSFMEEGNIATLSSVLRKAGIDLRTRLGVRDASVTAQGKQPATVAIRSRSSASFTPTALSTPRL